MIKSIAFYIEKQAMRLKKSRRIKIQKNNQ